jgi:acetyl-CoA acetyltransferase
VRDAFPRGQTAIVGAATFGVGTAPGYANFDLAAHASIMALAQAGLRPSDVDGLFCVVMDETLSGLNFAEYLGVRSRFNDNVRTGGSSFQIQASVAALALAAGQCDVALIAYGSNQRSSTGKLIASARSSPWEAPYKPLRPISSYAMAAARHMHQYGTTKQQLGEVAIAARKWAQLNPEAFSRDELTMEAYLGARMVADPLGVRD